MCFRGIRSFLGNPSNVFQDVPVAPGISVECSQEMTGASGELAVKFGISRESGFCRRQWVLRVPGISG